MFRNSSLKRSVLNNSDQRGNQKAFPESQATSVGSKAPPAPRRATPARRSASSPWAFSEAFHCGCLRVWGLRGSDFQGPGCRVFVAQASGFKLLKAPCDKDLKSEASNFALGASDLLTLLPFRIYCICAVAIVSVETVVEHVVLASVGP